MPVSTLPAKPKSACFIIESTDARSCRMKPIRALGVVATGGSESVVYRVAPIVLNWTSGFITLINRPPAVEWKSHLDQRPIESIRPGTRVFFLKL